MRRTYQRPAAAAVAAAVIGALISAPASPAGAAASPVTASDDAAATESDAKREAVRSGQRVEVLSERTEFTQMFAEPTGRLTYEAAAVPQRVRRADGSWRDIDLTLTRGGDGLVRPGASIVDVRFSGGGKGPLVQLTRAGETFTLTWPSGALPTPALSGDSATYAEVLPGVDLVVRATRTGFSHVLVVKTPQAAANPAVREVRFAVGGDTKVMRLPDGGLRAVAGGTVVASAATPEMWDSAVSGTTSGVATAEAVTTDPRSDAESTPAGPGDAAKVADVATAITDDGELLLRPDPALLLDSSRFPVYIDPAWSAYKSRWAYATNNNTTNSDLTRARVGADPDSGKLYRSFFEFNTSSLKAKHIESAYVQMVLDHSWSCGDTWTHMYHAGAITTPRTAWSTSLIKRVAAVASHANEGGGCADSPQPDMTVNFTGSDVTAMVQGVATKGTATVTVGFSARNPEGQYETDYTRWKKFYPDKAKLIADVDAKPGKPNNLQVNGVTCTTSTIAIGVTNPYFSAVMPDADTSQSIKATWQWAEAPQGGSMVTLTAPAATSAAANTRATSARVSGGVNGKRYAFRVMGTDPSPYLQSSEWSDWCYFTVDTTAPPVAVTPVSLPVGPGQPGEFQLSSDDDTVKFRYGWTEAVTSEVAAGTVAGVTGKSAKITVTAQKYGINVLYVQAIDATNNKGYGSREFTVGRPSPPVARWGLETYPGIDETAALDDQQDSLAGHTPVTGTNVTWTSDVRMIGGQVATFPGNAHLATSGPVVDTTQSFSVAAWVRLNSLPTTADMVVVAQAGSDASGFVLGTRLVGSPLTPRWSFLMKDTAAQSSATRAAVTTTAITSADLGRWVHITGVYDNAAAEVRLYVDGKPAAQLARTATPWAASGPLGIGRGLTSGSPGNWFNGNVADVQVFNRVIVDDDFIGQTSQDPQVGHEPGILTPIEIGRWNFENLVPCYDPSVPDTCEAPDVGSEWRRRLTLTQGSDQGAGNASNGLALNDVHFIDDPTDPYYGSATSEYGLAQRNMAPDGEPAQWQDTPVLRTDQSFTVSVWIQPAKLDTNMTAVAQRGTKQSPFQVGIRQSTVAAVTGMRFEVTTVSADQDLNETYTSIVAPDVLTAETSTDWTHLVMVYDAGAKQVRLYVNGDLAATGSANLWHAGGPMTVGRVWWAADNTTGAWVDQWFGSIDDLYLYQGAMTSAQVAQLHDDQTIS